MFGRNLGDIALLVFRFQDGVAIEVGMAGMLVFDVVVAAFDQSVPFEVVLGFLHWRLTENAGQKVTPEFSLQLCRLGSRAGRSEILLGDLAAFDAKHIGCFSFFLGTMAFEPLVGALGWAHANTVQPFLERRGQGVCGIGWALGVARGRRHQMPDALAQSREVCHCDGRNLGSGCSVVGPRVEVKADTDWE